MLRADENRSFSTGGGVRYASVVSPGMAVGYGVAGVGNPAWYRICFGMNRDFLFALGETL